MKKKILFIIWSFSAGGGAEKILANVVNNLDKDKYDITILEYVKFGIKEEKINNNIKLLEPIINESHNKNNWEKLKYKIIKFITFNYPKIIRNLFVKDKYDIEIAFNYQIPTFLLSDDKDVKKFAWVHSSIEDLDFRNYKGKEQKRIKKRYDLQRKAFLKIDNIIAISNKTEESIRDLYPSFKDKIRKIYNGYDFEKIKFMSNENFNYKKKKNFTLLSIGRLVEQKNFSFLIEVGRILKRENFDYEILILGTGEQKNLLEKKIIEYNLQNEIKLLGFKENPYVYIKNSDLFCLTSKAEGFPTVLVEALALGCPFITTKIAGAEELSDGGKCGILENDIEKYSRKIISILNDNQKRKNMSANGMKFIERYSIENQISKIEALLR
ncbi:glycosyltransferase [Clostridium perfringens]|uniref:glycosyltransferase n=1 Tax=Clostridium perfringens TaxID=1502 RepID=UPI002ACD3AC6|nr:glycosyltransferase [Clostridium perfringens]MDZ7545997.1 glycosyltransferase [Clostridium perfringens]